MVYEVAIDHPASRGQFVTEEDILPLALELSEQGQVAYHSIFTYDFNEVDTYLKSTGKIKGFRGQTGIPSIIMDVDKGNMTDDDVLRKARALLIQLEDMDVTEMRVWYSGTGYHIEIPNLFGIETAPYAPRHLRASMLSLFPTIDPIYDHTRIIRMPHTKNQKSGLYKIPLKPKEVFQLSATQIMRMATRPRILGTAFQPWDSPNSWAHWLKEGNVGEVPRDYSEITGYVGCMQKLYNEGPSVEWKDGSYFRHMKLMRLASAYRRQGLPLSAAITLGKEWVGQTHPHDDVEKVCRDVYEHAYKYSCADQFMRHYCVQERCKFYRFRNFNKETTVTPQEQAEQFRQYAQSDWQEKAVNLANIYPGANDFWFVPGELIYVTGDSGLGKSAVAQNCAVTFGKHTLYLNYEMDFNLWYRRQVQIRFGCSKEEAFELIINDPNTVAEALGHIHQTSELVDLPTLENMILDLQAELVVIDTADYIIVPGAGNNSFFKDETIAYGLKEIAKRTGTIIMAIVHLKKGDHDSTKVARRITLGDIKGSSSYTQKADQVLAFEGIRSHNRRILRSLKMRDGAPAHMNFLYQFYNFQLHYEL